MTRYSAILLLLLLCRLPLAAQHPCDELEASFSHQPHAGGIQFHDQSDLVGSVVWYQWSFGDGNTSFMGHPVHNYQLNGTYEVCLTIVTTLEVEGEPATCDAISCQLVEFDDGTGFTCDNHEASFEWEAGEGNAVIFHSTTTPVGGTHMWQFGDGHQQSGAHVTHVYEEPGEQWSCLVSYIWNDASQDICIDTHCENIMVGDGGDLCEPYIATFSMTILENTTVLFEQNSDPAAGGFSWNFGNNMTGVGPGVIHEYAAPGTYEICLAAWWWNDVLQDTCWSSFCDLLHLVMPAPCDTAFATHFGWAQNGGVTSFTAASGGMAAGYEWHYGDKLTFAGDMLEHEFTPGEHQICLVAWYEPEGGGDTCFTEHCQWINVVHGQTSCAELEVSFTAESSLAGVHFEHHSSFTGLITDILWEFGDEETSDTLTPMHQYAAAGTYDVCVTIWSVVGTTAAPDSCMATWCHEVTWEGAAGDPCAGNEHAFIGSPGNGLEMVFHDTSFPHPTGSTWDFGNGATGEGLAATHAYAIHGTYQVCLTSWWWNEALEDTCYMTTCDSFNVHGPLECDPTFHTDFTWEQQGPSFTFHASATHEVDGFIWNFGDGTTGAGDVVTHLYEPPGPFEVCLHAWYWNEATQDSCLAYMCHLVEWLVVDMCDPAFSVSISASPSGNTVSFTASASGGASIPGFIWDFGDGHSTPGMHATHTFQEAGAYTVCVSAWYWLPALDTCWTETCLNVEIISGMSEIAAAIPLTVHPVPAGELLYVSAPEGAPLPERVELLGMDGRLVLEERPAAWPHVMAVSGLAPGAMILRLRYSDGWWHQRVLIE